MKNSKIFLSLALLTVLGLGACNKGKGKSSSAPTSSESSASESSSSTPGHQHTPGEFGFCTCGEYLGQPYALEDKAVSIPNTFIGNMNVGDKRFFSVSGLTEKHGLHVEDWDGWDYDHENEIAADVHAYRVLDNGNMDELLIGYNTALDDMTQEPISFEEDKNVYFVIEAHKVINSGYLLLLEDHIYSDKTGACIADGEFRNGTFDGDTWETIPVGSWSKVGISFEDDEHYHYFKLVEDPNHLQPFSHHKFNLTLTNIPSNCVNLYYADENNNPVELSLVEGQETEVPENVHALYVRLSHKTVVSGGQFSLRIVEHCNEAHGYCPDCDLIRLPNSNILTMNADFGDVFEVVKDQKYTFAFDFGTTEQFAVQFNSSVWAHVASSIWLYVYDDVKKDFTLVYRASQATNEIEYDLDQVYYGTSKAFFEFTAKDSFYDVRIRVHDQA
ncbi:MAG: hypothetical protein IJK27_02930 [Bacilli bacterium]|nr:hypothetical protein [Bacilli bacterium]